MLRQLKFVADRVIAVGDTELSMPGPADDPNREIPIITAALSKGRNQIERLVIKGGFREKAFRCLKKGLTHRNNRVVSLEFSGTSMTAGALRVLQETLIHPNCRIRELRFTSGLPSPDERRGFREAICNSQGKVQELWIGPRLDPRRGGFRSMTVEDAEFVASILSTRNNRINKLELIRAVNDPTERGEALRIIASKGLASLHSTVTSLRWEQDPLSDHAVQAIVALVVLNPNTSVKSVGFKRSGSMSEPAFKLLAESCRDLWIGPDMFEIYIQRILQLVHSKWFRTLEILIVALVYRRRSLSKPKDEETSINQVLLPLDLIRVLSRFLPKDEGHDVSALFDANGEQIDKAMFKELLSLVDSRLRTEVKGLEAISSHHTIERGLEDDPGSARAENEGMIPPSSSLAW